MNQPTKVVFLDYDGVVNTPMWSYDQKKDKYRCSFGYAWEGKVNNFQAVQWVSEFCEKYGYGIVVSSTWRLASNYDVCLISGGLRPTVEILGRTPRLNHDHATRGEEISLYLSNHPEITHYLIFDDDTDMGPHLPHLVKCNPDRGFGLPEYNQAVALHNQFHAEDPNTPPAKSLLFL